ncbi:MAG: alanine racemase [Campylobacterota bacterium]|nr:alanine racemase [Campylobacterota bacterium]
MAYITLNKNNFFHNLDIIVDKTENKSKVALVLKDNAYGHGLLEIASMAKEYGITKCVVQTSLEAEMIKDFFDYTLVLADYPIDNSSKVRYTINDINSITRFQKGTKVELKIDTGMHRNGIAIDELYSAFKKIKEQGLELEAIFTHHRSADELSSEWYWQNAIFKKIKIESNRLSKEFNFKQLRFHSSNSASLFRCNHFKEDMVRVGIAAYGCLDMPNSLALNKFKPVLALYASKISSRKLIKGSKIGYGATYKFQQECMVSNYDFGYGDGFLRANSNNYKTPKGFELVGRVSMDNSSFISEDEELLIFNSATVASKFAQTISYEVLTSLKKDIKRSIVEL